MKNRREFLKGTGAVLLGSQSAFALAESLSSADQEASSAKSKVVIARDPALHGQSLEPNEQRVINLLDHAMATYTGRDTKRRVEARDCDGPGAGQGHRIEGQWTRQQGDCDAHCAHYGGCRTAAAGWSEARQHPCVGSECSLSRSLRHDREYRSKSDSLLLIRCRRLRGPGVFVGCSAHLASPRSLRGSARRSSTCRF